MKYFEIKSKKDNIVIDSVIMKDLGHSPRLEKAIFCDPQEYMSRWCILRKGLRIRVIDKHESNEMKSLRRLRAKILNSQVIFKAFFSLTFTRERLVEYLRMTHHKVFSHYELSWCDGEFYLDEIYNKPKPMGYIIDDCLRKIKQIVGSFEYVWRYEEGKLHNRPHFHLLTSEYIPLKTFYSVWKYGNIDAEKIDSIEKSKAYILKYVSKLKKARGKEWATKLKFFRKGRRWATSRGIKWKDRDGWRVVGYSRQQFTTKDNIQKQAYENIADLNLNAFQNKKI